MNFMWQSSETMEEEMLKYSVLETFRKFGNDEFVAAVFSGVIAIIALIIVPDVAVACAVPLFFAIAMSLIGVIKKFKCKNLKEFEWTQATITHVLLTAYYKNRNRNSRSYVPLFWVGDCKCKWLSGFAPTKSWYRLDEEDECKAYEGSPVYLVRVPKSSNVYMIPYAPPVPKEKPVSFDDEPITFKGGSGTMKF